MLEVVKWMMSEKDLSGCTKTDPPWITSFSQLAKFQGVELILVYGNLSAQVMLYGS